MPHGIGGPPHLPGNKFRLLCNGPKVEMSGVHQVDLEILDILGSSHSTCHGLPRLPHSLLPIPSFLFSLYP